MGSDPIKKEILDSFSSSSKKDWIHIASKELEGADPFEKLKKNNQGLIIYPYYDVSDDISTPFQLPVSAEISKTNRTWENLSIVDPHEPHSANQEALLALQSGADGILFSLEQNFFSELLLKNIQWEHCSLRFFAKEGQENFFNFLKEFALKQNLNSKELQGSVFWKSLPQDFPKLMKAFEKWEKFHCTGIFLEHGESKQKMIGDALAQAVHVIDIATRNGIPVAQAIRQLAFSVSIGTDFFLEIAVLKTLRRLWHQITMAYNVSPLVPVHIHAHSTAFTKSEFQAHANLIKSSTAALAAIAGGCDSLSIEPENPKNPMLSRVARNVSSLLLEESHLGDVADPTAGSYYIENLTDQLSQSAWKIFQERTIS